MRLLGTRGTYEKYGMDPQEASLKSGLGPGNPNWGVEPLQSSGRLSTLIGSEEFNGTIVSERGSYEKFYQLMYDAIALGAPVPVPPQDALKTLHIIEAARLTAASARHTVGV